MKFWLALLISILSFGMASAQITREPGINVDELDRRATAMMKQSDMTGMSMAIVENGRVTFAKGYGETIHGSGQAVDQNTIFRWASVSKGVAASTLLGLVEARRIDAKQSVETLAPSLHLPPTAEKHDIVDLLSHRIGIVRNAYDGRIEDGRDAKMLRAQLGGLNYVCPPRTCHTYQNVAFDAAAEIIEEATALPYKTVVQREVFDPLGMTTASLTLDAMVHSRNWARPHRRDGQLISHIKASYYRVPAAAGVNSSVVDLARWMTALMPNKPGRMPTTPFPTARLTAMQTPVVATPGEQRMMDKTYGALNNSHYGLGLRIYDYNGHKVVGHRGGVEGYRSLILFDPEKQAGIAIMWNSPHGQPIGLQMEFMDQLYGLPKRDWLRLSRRRS